ncbi:hypothetical protein HA402_006862 [Bradysia odoriphaga]|nr:hypothetical protein HA402_006862 [Bradysia odoriphaga]
MSVDDINVEALIRDIFIRPPIWDGSFGNKDFFWREISANHNFLPVDTLKRRWENLRRSFRTQLKKIPRTVNNLYLIDPHDLPSAWPYYRSMLFLVDRVRLGNQNQLRPPQIEYRPIESIPQNVYQNRPNADTIESAKQSEKKPNEDAESSNIERSNLIYSLDGIDYNKVNVKIEDYPESVAQNVDRNRPSADTFEDGELSDSVLDYCDVKVYDSIECVPRNVNRKRHNVDSLEETGQQSKKKRNEYADSSNVRRSDSSDTLDGLDDHRNAAITKSASSTTLNWTDNNDPHLIKDSDRYYLKSLLPYLEKLDAVQKLVVRSKIDEILRVEISKL